MLKDSCEYNSAQLSTDTSLKKRRTSIHTSNISTSFKSYLYGKMIRNETDKGEFRSEF